MAPVIEDASQLPVSPQLPYASPVGDIACPLGPAMSPHLTTPAWPPAWAAETSDGFPARAPNTGNRGPSQLAELMEIDKWAWEVGSEAGSLPSAWSKPSTMASSKHSSRISSTTGDGLIPGLVDGQRLSGVKPSSVPTAGGKVVVSLRKEVPQGYWDNLEIVLVNGPVQVRLKPTGIKKGKKLCVEVPAGLQTGDYDVRLSFHNKIIHGAIPLSVRDGESDDEEVSEGELADNVRNLAM
eukprot:CAMPEP_0170606482 /NCGR_PEP_ID=MMETSP0224-20130122/20536_1 /TAXON_ID=285029 /ORGANISM="Togula jolla, Strain CCCM 725" /LENGTH=238 /DNA_ID=CAMNT_0010931567 /DNA_START=8 /DNA_END=724 /DNA_ORIENTATION=+